MDLDDTINSLTKELEEINSPETSEITVSEETAENSVPELEPQPVSKTVSEFESAKEIVNSENEPSYSNYFKFLYVLAPVIIGALLWFKKPKKGKKEKFDYKKLAMGSLFLWVVLGMIQYSYQNQA